jgi:TP901 family phage tail tape measure protein
VPNATVGVLRVLLTGNSAEFDAAMKKAGDSAKAWGKDLTAVGKQASDVGMALTKTLTLPLAGVAAAAVKAGTDFEKVMNSIQGVLTPTGDQLDRVREKAMQMGADTAFSAGDAATAILELGKAGFDTETAISSVGDVLQLAAASGLDMGQAAEMAARTLNAFGMESKDLSHVNDVLAKAVNSSSLEISDLQTAFGYIGPIAQGFGMSIEQASAALAIMRDSGIAAETSGRALREGMSRLANPVKSVTEVMADLGIKSFESNGKLMGLSEIVSTLQGKGLTAAQSLKLFGDAAGPGMFALVSKGRDALDGLTSDFEKSEGSAKAMADAMMKGLPGAMERLRGSIETAMLSISKAIEPAVLSMIGIAEKLADVITKVIIPAFAAMPVPLQMGALGMVAFAAAIGPVIFIVGQLISAVGTITLAFGTKGIAMRAMTALYPAWAAVVRGATVAVAGLTAVMGPLSIAIGGVALAWAAWQKASAETGWIREVSDGFQYAALRVQGYTAAQADAMIESDHAAQRAREAKQAIQDLGGAATQAAGAAAPLAGGMRMLASHGADVAVSVAKAGTAAKGFSAELALTRQQVAALTRDEREAIIAGDALGKSTSEIAEAMHLSEAAVNLFKEGVDKSAEATKKATKEKKDFWEAVNRLNENALPPYVALLQNVSTELGETEFFGKSITRVFDEQARAVGVLTDKYQPLKAAVVENRTDTQRAEKETKEYTFSVEDLSKAISQLAQVSGDSFGGIVKHVSTLITSINAAQKAVSAMADGFGALKNGGGIQAIAQMGMGALGMVSAIWQAGSAVVNLVRGLFGVSAEVKKARQEVDTFQQSLANTLTETQKASAGGVQWKMTVIAVRDAYLATGRSAAEAEAIVRQLWDTDRPDRARAAIEKINAVLGEQKLEQELLQEAIQEYGFSIEELGPKFQAQRLSEQAQRLVEHYAVLIESGVENGVVIDKMAEKTNDYLATALRTNAEIPKSMEPMLQAMLEQGLLTDENGEKLTDLGRITWAETMTQGFDRVVGAVERLINALSGIPTQIGIDVVGTYIPPDIPDVTAADPGFASGTMGRFGQWMGDFGKGTPTMLHGREMVVPQAQIPSLFADMLSAASPSAQLSAGPVVGIPSMGSPGDLPVAAALAIGREAVSIGVDMSGVIGELRSVRRLLSELPGDIKMGYKAALAGA